MYRGAPKWLGCSMLSKGDFPPQVILSFFWPCCCFGKVDRPRFSMGWL